MQKMTRLEVAKVVKEIGSLRRLNATLFKTNNIVISDEYQIIAVMYLYWVEKEERFSIISITAIDTYKHRLTQIASICEDLENALNAR